MTSPNITSVSPSKGSQGTTFLGVIFQGCDFTNVIDIYMGPKIYVTGFRVESDTVIRVNMEIAHDAQRMHRRIVMVASNGETSCGPAEFVVS